MVVSAQRTPRCVPLDVFGKGQACAAMETDTGSQLAVGYVTERASAVR
jgi:hypothetical protein